MIEVLELERCPKCGGEAAFVECMLPTGMHLSCKFICQACGFKGAGVAQRTDTPDYREWGRSNAVRLWNSGAIGNQ